MNQQVENYLRQQAGGDPMRWLNQPYPVDPQMQSRFRQITEAADALFIIGDYDTDGIMSSKILKDGLREMYPDKTISAMLPDRFRDGYGMNNDQIDRMIRVLKLMADRGKPFYHPCIITCDNGISCAETIAYAKEQIPGLSVIITDHHPPKRDERGELLLPDADLICNPHVAGFRYEHYCGAGVAYKLVSQDVPDPLRMRLEMYAGIATVADMVPMKEDNWVITRHSLDYFSQHMKHRDFPPALNLLCKELGIEHPSQVNEEFYAYTLSPLCNAMGRLQDYGARRMYKFLDDPHPTQDMCQEIIDNNKRRKAIVAQMSERLALRPRVQEHTGIAPLWVMIPGGELGAEEGLCGLYASELVKLTGAPSIVLTPSRRDPSIWKGSGRNIPGFDLNAYLTQVAAPYLKSFGGHKEACGLSATIEGLRALSRDSRIALTEPFLYEDAQLEAPHFIDTTANMTRDYQELRAHYAPFGQDYFAPVYELELDASRQEFETMGEGKHFQTKLDGLKVIHFHHDADALADPEHFRVTGKISENYWNGRTSYQFIADTVEDYIERELEEEQER